MFLSYNNQSGRLPNMAIFDGSTDPTILPLSSENLLSPVAVLHAARTLPDTTADYFIL